MPTFYRHDKVIITADFVQFGDARFQQRELTYVHTRVVSEPAAVRTTRLIWTACAVEAGVVLALSLTASQPLVLIGAAIVLATAATAIAHQRLRRQIYQLWATVKGEPFRLFATSDTRAFGQVTRALVRSLEHAKDAP